MPSDIILEPEMSRMKDLRRKKERFICKGIFFTFIALMRGNTVRLFFYSDGKEFSFIFRCTLKFEFGGIGFENC